MALTTAILVSGTLYAREQERRYIHALAPQMFEQKSQGSALQRAAFREADLLPLYGTSELLLTNRYHASALFRNYPTGFTVFPVGKPGTTSLITLQDLAAVGADLRGKRVAISFSPGWFLQTMLDAASYAGNFSRLHASELVFSTQLSYAVKQGAARRMLDYPSTVEREPLLRFALNELADDSPTSRLLYYAVLPLGKLQTLVLRLQDHWETLRFLRAQQGLRPAVPREVAPVDWPAVLARAQSDTRRHSSNNIFGFPNDYWQIHSDEVLKQKDERSSAVFLRLLQDSKEWGDLRLLLRGLQDLGAEPLIISMPMNDTYFEFLGTSASALHAYSEKLQQVTEAAHADKVMDFGLHGGDATVFAYPGYHLTETGWVHYNYALDAFYHDRPLNDLPPATSNLS